MSFSADQQTDTGMRDVWGWAMSWFRKPPSSEAKRARQTDLVAVLFGELQRTGSVPDLHARYLGDSRWALNIARRDFPKDWPTLGLHACTATAYGLRYVELVTGRRVNPRSLPPYLGEWAIW